ncbi:hypothetical protein J4E91_003209 [Alternaria rosae]|nr:hypothetical protein J4E91_003209 [Alternaria rosae]
MLPRSRQPLRQRHPPKDESDRLVIASERVLTGQNSEFSKLDDEYEELRAQADNVGHEQEYLVKAYHGADSKATRLDGQNKRLRAQLELGDEERDDFVERLAGAQREIARLKSAKKEKKRKREDLPSSFEKGPDVDKSASKTEEKPRAKVHRDLILGRPKPQEMTAAVGEEERIQKRPRRRRYRDEIRSTVQATVEVEAVVEEKMNA